MRKASHFRDNIAYKIGVPFDHREEAGRAEFWPEGLAVPWCKNKGETDLERNFVLFCA